MRNLDNQPGRNTRADLNTGTINNGVDDRRTGLGTGTITAIIAAVLIAGALMLFGPWSNNNRTAVNTTPSSNSTTGTTTGQSTAPRVITPSVTPAAPSTTAPAPTAR